MIPLHSVARDCKVQGGLRTLTLVDPSDLATQPTWNVGATVDFDFIPGRAAYYLEQDLRSGRVRSDTDIGAQAGDFITYRLEAQVRSIRATVESLRAKLHNRRVHVVATYTNGVNRLLPYMRLAFGDDSGQRRSNYQGYNITGTTRLQLPGPGIGGNIETVAPPTGGGGGTAPGGTGVELVTITTTSTQQSYTIPAGRWLVGWELQGSADQTVSVGLVAGSEDLGGPVELVALQSWAGAGNMIPSFNPTNIYFTGLTGTNTIKIWLLV